MINGKQHMDTTRVSNSSSNRHKPSGATIHPEPSIEVHGIGLVPQPPSSNFFSKQFYISCRGNSGYGRFDVENFTQRRIFIVHPEEVKFPLVDDLGL